MVSTGQRSRQSLAGSFHKVAVKLLAGIAVMSRFDGGEGEDAVLNEPTSVALGSLGFSPAADWRLGWLGQLLHRVLTTRQLAFPTLRDWKEMEQSRRQNSCKEAQR